MAAIPTTEIVGPEGTLVINTTDLPEWKAKGYCTLEEHKSSETEEQPKKTKK